MKKPQLLTRKIAASLVCLALLIFTGSALADNTGSGGTIVYTDSNGLNPVASLAYIGGFVVHKFTTTGSGTLIIPSSVSADVLVVAGGGGGGARYAGGGGAGAAGGDVNGGVGLQYAISGVTNYYAGGGGGITTGSGGLGGGGNPGASGQNGFSGAANTGGGGGGAFGSNNGGVGGSGIVIVRYSYDPGTPSVSVTSPTNGSAFVGGSSISATALVGGGATPYSVTYYYKLTTDANYTATTAVGPFGATNTFTQTLGTLPNGVYQFYATVADSAAGTATSVTNTLTVYAVGNTGLGGTVVYTDSNGLNPVSGPAYVGGYVVQTFTANGTLILPSSASADVLVVAGGGGGGGPYGAAPVRAGWSTRISR